MVVQLTPDHVTPKEYNLHRGWNHPTCSFWKKALLKSKTKISGCFKSPGFSRLSVEPTTDPIKNRPSPKGFEVDS